MYVEGATTRSSRILEFRIEEAAHDANCAAIQADNRKKKILRRVLRTTEGRRCMYRWEVCI